MENSRIDRQLRGRSGRQGDPGTTQIYISLEDYLVKRWSDHQISRIKRLEKFDTHTLQNSRLFQKHVRKIVKRAQRLSEEQGIKVRETSNEHEKSISVQRELVYKERNRVLQFKSLEEIQLEQLALEVFEEAFEHTHFTVSEWVDYIYKNLSFQYKGQLEGVDLRDINAVTQYLLKLFKQQLAYQRQHLDDYFYTYFVQKAILKAIDSNWIKQVDHLQRLKNSVNTRQNGKRNPIFEYHKVALESFELMTDAIKKDIVKYLCQSITEKEDDRHLIVHFPN